MKGAFTFIKLVKAISDGNDVATKESINQMCDIYAEEGNSMVRDEIDVILESGDFLKNLDFKKVREAYFSKEKPEKKDKKTVEVVQKVSLPKEEKTLCGSPAEDSSVIKNISDKDSTPKIKKPLKEKGLREKSLKETGLKKSVAIEKEPDSLKGEKDKKSSIPKDEKGKKKKSKKELYKDDDSLQLNMLEDLGLFGGITSL